MQTQGKIGSRLVKI